MVTNTNTDNTAGTTAMAAGCKRPTVAADQAIDARHTVTILGVLNRSPNIGGLVKPVVVVADWAFMNAAPRLFGPFCGAQPMHRRQARSPRLDHQVHRKRTSVVGSQAPEAAVSDGSHC